MARSLLEGRAGDKIMAGVGIGADIGVLRPKLTRWLIVVAILGALFFLVARVIGTGRVPRRPTTPQEAVSASHCSQFIALAEAKYGLDWKAKLDPRDTTCAQQIHQEWVRQQSPREIPSEPALQPTMMPSEQPSPLPMDAALAADVARARNPETYCLNVISLAKVKYGSDWRGKVAPAEAASCEAQIEQTR